MSIMNLISEFNKIIKNQNKFYIRLDRSNIDFVDNKLEFKLIISSLIGTIEICINKNNVRDIVSLLKDTIFTEGKILIAWNIKSFFTYVLFSTKKLLEFSSTLFDLKVIESYLFINKKEPIDFLESLNRCKDVFAIESSAQFKNIYKNIYLELIKKIIPELEVIPIGDKENNKFLYSCYDLASQVNGRLSCFKPSDNYYNPQLMEKDIRNKIKPIKHFDGLLIFLDYSFFEVRILHWLCRDEVLEEYMQGDFYKNFYKSLFFKECDSLAKRKLSKEIFLPIIYGQCANNMANTLNISVDFAKKIINKTKKIFKKTFDWMNNYKIDDEGVCFDHFGRKRIFEKEAEYKYRNFIIQSPASLFCLDKLVNLSKVITNFGYVICNIHDGYIVVSNKKNLEDCKSLSKKILESESIFFPNLKIMVECKVSNNL